MKKIFKILGVVAGGMILAVVIFLMIGPKDPVVLTPEQKKQENLEQTKKYASIDLKEFNAKTITGESITADYFKDYDITMINLWTTTCSPCIAEMPDIAKLYKDRPQKSNIISICADLGDKKKDIEFAKKVMSESKAEFLTLIPDNKLKKSLTDKVNIFPTTIFVDKNGKIVGEPHFGGRTSEDYKKAILDRISLLNSK